MIFNANYCFRNFSLKTINNQSFIDIGEDARRQYVDATAAFTAWEDAKADAQAVSGGMYWRNQGGVDYLIRTSRHGGQRGLGPRSPANEDIINKFLARKTAAEQRLTDLREQLTRHQRMNRALHVGRTPQLLVEILAALAEHGLATHFTVVGTHALYAYEAAAGARFGSPAVLATQDVDLLWDTRKRLQFETDLSRVGTSMVGVLQKVDPTFRIRPEQRYTAVNSKGFEVDIIRREAKALDPHPLRLSGDEGDFWVVQARRAGVLLSAPRFSSIVVSVTGHMARMNTIAPKTLIAFKHWMALQSDRDPMKRGRDRTQADAVAALIAEFLPNAS